MENANRNIRQGVGEWPKISVIVPIYNMEKLMRKCLNSILAQTFHDYECLLIDDGSKDGSPTICDEYATRDPRFTAFHKSNGGLSDARNYGLARAKGDYTIFFDPDDWVDEDCLKDLYAKAQETNADLVMCDIYYNDSYRQSCCKQEPTGLQHLEVLKDLITGKVFGFTVNKLIRRDLYKKYNLQYPIGLYGCEDQYTMCELLKNDIKIAYLPKAYYHYMHFGNESQSRKYNQEIYEMDLQMRTMFCELLDDTNYKSLANDSKSNYILHRAFMFGQHTFSSKAFKEAFGNYQYLLQGQKPGCLVLFYRWSINGYYQVARRLFSVLYEIKQLIKKIKFHLQK